MNRLQMEIRDNSIAGLTGRFGRRAILAFLLVLSSVIFAGIHSEVASTATSAVYTIKNEANGYQCAEIGTWDADTLTCTLTQDVNIGPNHDAAISVVANEITIDGANHAIKAPGSGSTNAVGINVGLFSGTITGVIIKNVTISGFDSALTIFNCSGCIVPNNNLSNNGYGLQLYGTSSSIISDNTANDNSILSVPAIGIYLNSATGNTVSGNLLARNGTNIELVNNSNGNTIRNNDIGSSLGPTGAAEDGYGLRLDQSSDNIVTGNIASGDGTGMKLELSSNSNKISLNNFNSNFSYGIDISSSNNNEVYRNNFVNNGTQARVVGIGNIFNKELPGGGNYWNDWTSPDVNNDGFVDNQYLFSGGQDNLPMTDPLVCMMPPLSYDKPKTFWASFADYQARELSAAWVIKNDEGGFKAYSVTLSASTDSNDVSLLTTLPLSFGDIKAGSEQSVMLKYYIPPGVASWYTKPLVSAQDGCGTIYTIP